jgi:hypothetical protein
MVSQEILSDWPQVCCRGGWRPVRLAYQPPASSTFLSEQTSHQQPANSNFLSEQNKLAISHQPNEQAVGLRLWDQHWGRKNLHLGFFSY